MSRRGWVSIFRGLRRCHKGGKQRDDSWLPDLIAVAACSRAFGLPALVCRFHSHSYSGKLTTHHHNHLSHSYNSLPTSICSSLFLYRDYNAALIKQATYIFIFSAHSNSVFFLYHNILISTYFGGRTPKCASAAHRIYNKIHPAP